MRTLSISFCGALIRAVYVLRSRNHKAVVRRLPGEVWRDEVVFLRDAAGRAANSNGGFVEPKITVVVGKEDERRGDAGAGRREQRERRINECRMILLYRKRCAFIFAEGRGIDHYNIEL